MNVHVDYDKIPVLDGNGDGISFGSRSELNVTARPNPVENQFTMKLNNPVKEKIRYQVLNLEGSVLLAGEFLGDETHKLLLTDLKAGMYILSYVIHGERKQMNIIKE